MASACTTRLHISPLTPELLQSILRLAAVEAATDISFHSAQTFPENSYGFVNLSKMEAEKVVKKLNGTILKGKKLKIHEARPSKCPLPDSETLSAPSSTSPQSRLDKASKKRKSTDNIVGGFELPQGRHVKRGWTEPAGHTKRSRKPDEKGKHKSRPSKYIEKPECLFRVTVPPNRADITKEKNKSSEKKRSKHPKNGEVVVHEFENLTTIPSFFRTGEKPSEASLTSEYLDGKGWLDGAGNVKEEPVIKERPRVKQTPMESKKIRESKEDLADRATPRALTSGEADNDETSSSGSSSENSSEEEDSDSDESDKTGATFSSTSSSSVSDSAVTSSSSENGAGDEEDVQSESDAQIKQPNNTLKSITRRSILVTPSKDSTNPAVTRKVSHPAQDSNLSQPPAMATEVHPLEALFKRPAKRRGPKDLETPLEINTQFSFFGEGDGDNDDIEQERGDHAITTMENGHNHFSPDAGEPQTPFTKHDLMSRTVRSGAPTPDTTAPNKSRFWGDYDIHQYGNGDGAEVGSATPSKSAETAYAAPTGKDKEEEKNESEFAKWFWENRGENNRAWKRRRREASKMKRQRENRQKGIRGK
ncbi:hypothetical protein I7I48_01920 [Histoplasma ohiense]|nr:hypothetical protein I7I48_01920 [Histoplasma ohiense (nom. inval.)]